MSSMRPSKGSRMPTANWSRRPSGRANARLFTFPGRGGGALRSRKILYGSNFESEVYPAGLCAERSLMFYAQANYAI